MQNESSGKLQAFRAQEYLEAFTKSSARLDMPTFSEDELHGCIKELCKLDKDWLEITSQPD